jgi:hypothetical protein
MSLCVLCLQDLGVAPRHDTDGRWRAPSTELRVCSPGAGKRRAWKLSTLGEDPVYEASLSFDNSEVEKVYHLCGGGHIELVDRPFGRQDGEEIVPMWNCKVTLAAVGDVAVGKSYLLARTLAQPLFPDPFSYTPGRATALGYQLSGSDTWEDIAGKDLVRAYNQTRQSGLPMTPTMRETLLPAALLARGRISASLEFSQADSLIEALRRIHKNLPGGGFTATRYFGQWVRQPIVVRANFTQKGTRQKYVTRTGIADLAGESFTKEQYIDELQEEQLKNFDGLIWVVDPFADEQVTKLVSQALDEDEGFQTHGGSASVIAASTRPDESDADDDVHAERYGEVANQLRNMQGPLPADDPRRRFVNIVISKCDLIHKALEAGDFSEFGESRKVEKGVHNFIHYVLQRSDPARGQEQAFVAPSPPLAQILDSLRLVDTTALRKTVKAMGRGILSHFEKPDNFWRLAHGPDESGSMVRWSHYLDDDCSLLPDLYVPSLEEHLIASLQPHDAEDMQVRDFVMSALGCGVAYGLGFGRTVDQLIERGHFELRFFLCSPFVKLPTQTAGVDHERKLQTAEGGRFPALDAESAGLTQLMLAILRIGRQ